MVGWLTALSEKFGYITERLKTKAPEIFSENRNMMLKQFAYLKLQLLQFTPSTVQRQKTRLKLILTLQ